MAEKPVQVDEGDSASSPTSASVTVSASSPTSASVSVSASSSTSSSVSVPTSSSTPSSVSVPALSSTSSSVSVPASSSTPSAGISSLLVAASASAYVSALSLTSASATANKVVSAPELKSLSELASAAWATDSAPRTSTSWAPQPVSTSSSVPLRLTDELPIKLDGVCNVTEWKKQVVRVLITENLLGFVTNPTTPKKYASEKDRSCDTVREEYRQWVIQDERLRTWLLSSLSENMSSSVTRKEHAWEVWSGVLEICRNELINNIKAALRAEIKNTKENKGDQTVRDFVSRITALASTLIALGDDVSEEEHVDALLQDLPDHYETLRAFIRERRERRDREGSN
ncbi:uncharacterized protein HKW66_Vig0087320 [Vigna angularis]|uniref:Uncharacterized protein n=1 Tax=Phaseolus angularis TaxID=3914 RepID=A0A8T0KFV4_PHAAN|nr:A-agglutinin anchorage subunit-like [Vigna angularis]XP_052732061.1 A-agglutinin anchorage subunit-like [Vigna angularis]KAG2398787.1 uncharacterized protein HKW66_Vig0087320 [Vigna angularis]